MAKLLFGLAATFPEFLVNIGIFLSAGFVDAFMRPYENDGKSLYVSNEVIFEPVGEVHEIDDVQEDNFYLYDDKVVSISPPEDYETFVAIHTHGTGDDVIGKDLIEPDEFDGAKLLESWVPSNIYECPDCGGWAGNKGENESPQCLNCGFGLD